MLQHIVRVALRLVVREAKIAKLEREIGSLVIRGAVRGTLFGW